MWHHSIRIIKIDSLALQWDHFVHVSHISLLKDQETDQCSELRMDVHSPENFRGESTGSETANWLEQPKY